MDPDPFSFFITAPYLVGFVFIQIGLVVLLLLMSALISGAEVAFFSLNPKLLETNESKDQKSIDAIIKLLEHPKRLLATILVVNNFINIAIVLVFSTLSDYFLAEVDNPIVLLLIEVGIITSIILVFGEILPKIYANRNPLQFSKMMITPVSFSDRYLLFWITIPMSWITQALESTLGQKNNDFSVDKLSQALELTSDKETTSEEQKILEGIVNFGSTDTKQVMCPRIDIFALSEALTMNEIVPKILDEGFSRIPIYTEKVDKIKGILYVKDLLPEIENKDFQWQNIIREPFYVPENKKLDDLLREFQLKKIHLAIVVDEYGGTSGLITLEDIIEQIVGEISDEFDEEALHYSKLDNQTYVFDAKINLKDFFKVIDIQDPEPFERAKGDAETLAGLLLEITQKFPLKNQKIKYDTIDFTVEDIDQKRIKRVKVKLHGKEK